MFSTLRTLLRASSSETEEALIDANAPRLMAQHLRDARADLARGRATLASLISLEKQEAREAAEAAKEGERREGEAREAFAAGEDALGGELSERILDIEDRCSRAKEAQAEIGGRIEKLRDHLRQVESKIARLTEELRLAKLRGAAQIPIAVSAVRPDSLSEAEVMAVRMRDNAIQTESRIEAMAEPRNDTSSDLDSRLREAGVGDARAKRRDALLSRLNSSTSN